MRRVESIAEVNLQEILLGWRSLSIGIFGKSPHHQIGGGRRRIGYPHSRLEEVELMETWASNQIFGVSYSYDSTLIAQILTL